MMEYSQPCPDAHPLEARLGDATGACEATPHLAVDLEETDILCWVEELWQI